MELRPAAYASTASSIAQARARLSSISRRPESTRVTPTSASSISRWSSSPTSHWSWGFGRDGRTFIQDVRALVVLVAEQLQEQEEHVEDVQEDARRDGNGVLDTGAAQPV